MPRRFNTAGPNDPEYHYTLPVLARLQDVRRFIDEQHYFILTPPAGRQDDGAALARPRADA